MTEDTLSQGHVFDRSTVKTTMSAQERYALTQVGTEHETGMATVRRMLCAGLDANGWDEAKRVEAYAAYKAGCLRAGTYNEFEGR
jgi:hypothetical protein